MECQVKKIICLFTLTLSLTTFSGISVQAKTNKVVFADKNLEKVVRQKIHKEIGTITKQDVSKITELLAYDKKIKSLKGVENLTNLVDLSVYDNNITDVTPVENLKNLKELSIRNNQISNIKPISKLKKLKLLYLRDNKIKDYSCLSKIYDSIGDVDFDLNGNVIYQADDWKYNGSWKNSNPNGYGRIEFSDSSYEGQFIDGNYNGIGEINYNDGSSYKGEFKDGKYCGLGVETYNTGDNIGDKYEGQFTEDKRTGLGIYTWKNGDKYIGEFVNGNSEGYGCWTSTSGNKQLGYWKDDKYIGTLDSNGKDSYVFPTSSDVDRLKEQYDSEISKLQDTLYKAKNNKVNRLVKLADGNYCWEKVADDSAIKIAQTIYDNKVMEYNIWKEFISVINNRGNNSNSNGNSGSNSNNSGQVEQIRQQYLNHLQELQAALDNAKNNKTQQVMVKMPDGTYQFQYVADAQAVARAQQAYDDYYAQYVAWENSLNP